MSEKLTRLPIHLTEKHIKYLEKHKEREGKPMAEQVRRIIDMWIWEHEEYEDVIYNLKQEYIKEHKSLKGFDEYHQDLILNNIRKLETPSQRAEREKFEKEYAEREKNK